MMRNKKVMPRVLCAAASLALAMPFQAMAGSPEFARTAEEWARLQDNVLEYEEIEDLIHEYNTTVLNNENEYAKDRGKSADEFVDDLLAIADDYYTISSNADDDLTAITNEVSARQAEINAENNVDDSDTKRLGYTNTEKTIVKQAQTSMNTYYQLQQQLTSLVKSRELLAASLNSAQGRQVVGMATYTDVLNAQQSLQSTDAQIAALQNQIETTRQNLIVMMGWTQDAQPEIRPMPELDLNRIAAMNLEADTQKALENDYTLQADELKLKNSTNDANRNIYTQTIANDKQQIAVAVNQAYQAVYQAKDSFDEALLNLDITAKDYTSVQTKYQLGTASYLEFLQSETAYVAAQTSKEIAGLTLFQALENYDWVVKGVR